MPKVNYTKMSKRFFKLAKTPIGDLIVGLVFGKLNKLLPVKKIKENEMVVAFWHPKPYWEKHILLVPKKAIKSLSHISDADSEYVQAVFKLAKDLVISLGWDKSEYSVLVNGGKRQEVNQLHFHLHTGKQL